MRKKFNRLEGRTRTGRDWTVGGGMWSCPTRKSSRREGMTPKVGNFAIEFTTHPREAWNGPEDEDLASLKEGRGDQKRSAHVFRPD